MWPPQKHQATQLATGDFMIGARCAENLLVVCITGARSTEKILMLHVWRAQRKEHFVFSCLVRAARRTCWWFAYLARAAQRKFWWCMSGARAVRRKFWYCTLGTRSAKNKLFLQALCAQRGDNFVRACMMRAAQRKFWFCMARAARRKLWCCMLGAHSADKILVWHGWRAHREENLILHAWRVQCRGNFGVVHVARGVRRKNWCCISGEPSEDNRLVLHAWCAQRTKSYLARSAWINKLLVARFACAVRKNCFRMLGARSANKISVLHARLALTVRGHFVCACLVRAAPNKL